MRTLTLNKIREFYFYITALFLRKKVAVAPPRKQRQPRDKPNVSHECVGGEFMKARDLLEGLDKTFKQMKKMEPKRKSLQTIIRKYGPFVLGANVIDNVYGNYLEGFKAYGLPSCLIGYWPERADMPSSVQHGRDIEQFFCATRIYSLPYLGKRRGFAYYEVGVVALPDEQTKADIGMTKPAEFGYYICVDKKTGNVTTPSVPFDKRVCIPAKSSAARKYSGSHHIFTKRAWESPDWIDDNERHTQEEIKKDLIQRFCVCYSLIMRREYGVNIIVKKGKRRATFIVPSNRWRYFFSERIDVMTQGGRKRPIYHAVVAHKRNYRNGKESYVKTHYRGSRSFVWNGYQVQIIMQGRHAPSQASFNLEGMTVEDSNSKMLDIKETGDIVNKLFDGDSSMVRN